MAAMASPSPDSGRLIGVFSVRGVLSVFRDFGLMHDFKRKKINDTTTKMIVKTGKPLVDDYYQYTLYNRLPEVEPCWSQ
jgi:hypothetical protein